MIPSFIFFTLYFPRIKDIATTTMANMEMDMGLNDSVHTIPAAAARNMHNTFDKKLYENSLSSTSSSVISDELSDLEAGALNASSEDLRFMY